MFITFKSIYIIHLDESIKMKTMNEVCLNKTIIHNENVESFYILIS